jgi:hypothetical protein
MSAMLTRLLLLLPLPQALLLATLERLEGVEAVVAAADATSAAMEEKVSCNMQYGMVICCGSVAAGHPCSTQQQPHCVDYALSAQLTVALCAQSA